MLRLAVQAMRLDVFLLEFGYASSRTEAKNYIVSGCVTVNGRKILKPSFIIDDSEPEIFVDKTDKKYVSRGGIKLEDAIDKFNIDVQNKLCLDIGASSGGFTDCLLQYGANHVISVDSGSGQIAESLRNSKKVTVIENYNARYMKSEDFEYIPNLAVMDVSFISATYIIPSVYEVISFGSDFICLIKPQFEVGKAGLSKGGIVKDKRTREAAKDKVIKFATECGFEAAAVMESPITGGDGNIEYLAHFRKR